MTTQEQVKDVVSQVLADKADKGGIKRVVWIGAGGSNGGNYPAQYFMEHEATQVVSSSYTSNEFVHATPAYVNENTLAVVVSMRGTKETIVAAQVAKDHGASTIAIYVDESGLTEVCDYKIQYDSLAVDESCMGHTNSAVVTMIAMELTQQTEGYAEYETAMAAFDLVDPIYRKAVEYTRPLAAKWAEQNADKPCINVMAQGPLFGAAYVFSICNVQEMLQIDSCTINTCDFFHGPFEILDKRTSLFQLISVGPLQRRARHPLRQPVRWRARLSARRQGAWPQRHQGQRERVLQPPDLCADPQQRVHACALCRHPQGLHDAPLHVEA